MADSKLQGEGFSVSFSNREVTAWGGLALFKQMLDSIVSNTVKMTHGIDLKVTHLTFFRNA